MANRDIVVIGASAGGIEALKLLLKDLPGDFAAPIFIVLHIGAHGIGVLPRIFEKAGTLPASNARDHEEFKAGHIYVAPADHHLLLEQSGRIRLTRGPKENCSRPAIDPLFRSAAYAFGPRVVGVVLTGHLDDGTAGLWAIKERGGIAVVQHPDDAAVRSMPESALRNVSVDHCVPVSQMAGVLVTLVGSAIDEKGVEPVSDQMKTEVRIAMEDKATAMGLGKLGIPSLFACPECHGVLLQIKEGSHFRFRCHTGHAYSIETLLAECNERCEETLWNSVRALEESLMVAETMAEQLAAHQHLETAGLLRKQADEARRRADLVRKALLILPEGGH